MATENESVELISWLGPWDDDDRDANFKADVALYAHVDPMTTVRRLATSINVPEGAIVRYVLAKWASAGSAALLETGPTMVHRLWEPIEKAEEENTDSSRLEAYEKLRGLLSWLRFPLINEGDASGY
jgi:Family of unknown function (DUF6027)